MVSKTSCVSNVSMVSSSPRVAAAPVPPPLATIGKLSLSPGARVSATSTRAPRTSPPRAALLRLFETGRQRFAEARGEADEGSEGDGGDMQLDCVDDALADAYARMLQVALVASARRNRRTAAQLAAVRKANAELRSVAAMEAASYRRFDQRHQRQCGASDDASPNSPNANSTTSPTNTTTTA